MYAALFSKTVTYGGQSETISQGYDSWCICWFLPKYAVNDTTRNSKDMTPYFEQKSKICSYRDKVPFWT